MAGARRGRAGNVCACLRRAVRKALVLPLVASAFAAAAADAPPRAAGTLDRPLRTELVKPGLYRIGGEGGGVTLLRIGATGMVVVDANRAGTYPALMAEIQRIAKQPGRPVNALVLTAAGPAQAGNAAQFAEAGVPVIVPRQAVARLVADAGSPGVSLSRGLVGYGTDHLLRTGDVEAEIEHVGRGRTGADSVVLFRDLNLVAVGDLVPAGTPEPECASGGSFAGWAAAVDHVLWFDVDLFVPSRGAPVGKPELRALKARLEALAERSRVAGQPDCRSPG